MHLLSDATITAKLGRSFRVEAPGFHTAGVHVVPAHAIEDSSPVKDAETNKGPGELHLTDAWWDDHDARHG